MKKLPLIFLGLTLIGYGIFLHWGSGEEISLSPGLMPVIVGGLILIIAVFIEPNYRGGRPPVKMGLLIIGYGLLWYLVGARLSSFIFAVTSLLVFKKESYFSVLAFSVFMLIAVDLIFVRFFGIRLP